MHTHLNVGTRFQKEERIEDGLYPVQTPHKVALVIPILCKRKWFHFRS